MRKLHKKYADGGRGRRWYVAAAILAVILAVASCGGEDSKESGKPAAGAEEQNLPDREAESGAAGEEGRIPGAGQESESAAAGQEIAGQNDGSSGEQAVEGTFSAGEIEEIADSFGTEFIDVPEYTGSTYTAINDNVPFFEKSNLPTESFEYYSKLDNLGRCGTVCANIGRDIMPTKERESIGQVKPSGWQIAKYDNVDGKYLYNRCHLIGYQLSGENANERNLITGTRYLNVEGMLPFENMVADYVKETGNHVLYRVTPVFDGNDLLAYGVLMEGWSVEDAGEGICFNIFAYNVQPGIAIDYADGDSCLVEEAMADSGTASAEAPGGTPNAQQTAPDSASVPRETVEQPQPAPQGIVEQPQPAPQEIAEQPQPAPQGIAELPQPAPAGMDYILNTNTKKFHYPTCSSVGQMAEKNKQAYSGNREDIIAMGYEPCKRCNP